MINVHMTFYLIHIIHNLVLSTTNTYGKYSVWGPKFCEASIFMPSNNICSLQTLLIIKSCDLFKIVVSCMCNGIWRRILYSRLFDQSIPCLQGCLVMLQLEKCCTVIVMKWRGFWIRHCSNAEDTVLWYMQQWNQGISESISMTQFSVTQSM